MDSATRLAAAIRERRIKLGMTQEALAQATKAAGYSVSIQNVQAIEAGRRDSVMARTARGLELALKWPEGTVQAILDGKEPPAPEPEAPSEIDVIVAQVVERLREKEHERVETEDEIIEYFRSLNEAARRELLARLLIEFAHELTQDDD